MNALRSLRARNGAAAVEAALVLPVIVAATFGFIEFGLFINAQHVVHDAARQGARAAVRTENSNAQVQAAVLAALNNAFSVDPDAVTVRISRIHKSDGTEQYQVQNLNENEAGDPIRITVTVDFSQFHPPSNFFGIANRQIVDSVIMRRQK